MDLTSILKSVSIDLGYPFTMGDILGMEGVELDDAGSREAAVAKLHEKAKAIAMIPGHPKAPTIES